MKKFVIDVADNLFISNEESITDELENAELFDTEEDAKWKILDLKDEQAEENSDYVYQIKEVEISFKLK